MSLDSTTRKVVELQDLRNFPIKNRIEEFNSHFKIVLPDDIKRSAITVAKSSRLPAIITGETGSGKEEIAKSIHKIRCQLEGPIPFVPLNCATINNGLLQSTLFGHKKGSYTGATSARRGLVAEANGGILFLDEVHTLSLESQNSLLRVLHDGRFMEVGGNQEKRSSFQIIVATTKNLNQEVAEKNFLLDLLMRVTGIEIKIPPLRERHHELPLLIDHFFNKIACVDVSAQERDELVAVCKAYYWKGNIRQLFRALDSLVAICDAEGIPVTASRLPVYEDLQKPVVNRIGVNTEMAENPRYEPSVSHSLQNAIDILRQLEAKDLPLRNVLDVVEKGILEVTLKRSPTLDEARKVLNISRGTLDNKRHKHNLF